MNLDTKINTNTKPDIKTGKIKWFDPNKGYGFIRPKEGGLDLFLHVTELQKANIDNITNENLGGAIIEYEVRIDLKNRKSATNIRILDKST